MWSRRETQISVFVAKHKMWSRSTETMSNKSGRGIKIEDLNRILSEINSLGVFAKRATKRPEISDEIVQTYRVVQRYTKNAIVVPDPILMQVRKHQFGTRSRSMVEKVELGGLRAPIRAERGL